MSFSLDNHLTDRGLKLHNETLFTAREVKAGAILLEQQPLASIPLAAVRRERCNFCLVKLEKEKLLCCQSCHSAYFCGQKCFRNAWLRFHKNLCKPLEQDTYTAVDNDAWLLQRSALTLYNCVNKDITPPCLAMAAEILDSLPAQPRCTNENESQIFNDADCLDEIYDKDALSALWQRIKASRFTVTDYDRSSDPIAYAVYPVTARYVRHSCRPNAAFVYSKGKQHLVALEDLPSQKEITVSYVELLASKSKRAQTLQDRFGPDYVCTCKRCEGDLSGLDPLLDRAETLTKNMSSEDFEAQLSEYLKTWNVLNMTKLYTNNKGSESSLPILDVPNVTHYIGRIVFSDMYDAKKLVSRCNSRRSWLDYQDPYETIQRTKRTIESLHQIPDIPGLSPGFIHAAEKLLADRMATSKWVEAARLSIYLYSIYFLYYHPLHPNVARHCVITARTSWNSMIELELTGKKEKLDPIYEEGIRLWIKFAHNAVESTFGTQCDLYTEVIHLQWLYNRDQELKGGSPI